MGRQTRILAAMAIVVLGVTACGTSNQASGKIGGTVHILGTWTGGEKDSFVCHRPEEDQRGEQEQRDGKDRLVVHAAREEGRERQSDGRFRTWPFPQKQVP